MTDPVADASGDDTSRRDAGVDTSSDGSDAIDVQDTSVSDTPADNGGADDDGSSPVIVLFSTGRNVLEPGDSVLFSLIASDPDGIDDLIGAALEDEDGNSYGLFESSGEDGSYELLLTWSGVNDVASLDGPPGGVDRTFVARIYDVAGHETTTEATLHFTCGTESICTGVCADLDTDPDHCGACGSGLPDGWDQCLFGIPTCFGGRDYCDARCVDTRSNPDHCGGCSPLPAGWDRCLDGEPSCYNGYEYCGSECTDLDWDEDHCGECGNACPASTFCRYGQCSRVEYVTDGNTTCDVVCQGVGGVCEEATEYYSLRDTCTCEGMGCGSGGLDCDQSPNSRLDFCEASGSFYQLRCDCLVE